MAVVMNADQKKEMVKVARQYFSSTMTPDVAVRSMESSVLMYKGGRGKVQVLVTSLTAPLPSSAISVISTKCSPRW